MSLVFDPAEMTGPLFPVGLQQIVFKFGPGFRIKLLESRDGLEKSQALKKRGLTRLVESIDRLDRIPRQSLSRCAG